MKTTFAIMAGLTGALAAYSPPAYAAPPAYNAPAQGSSIPAPSAYPTTTPAGYGGSKTVTEVVTSFTTYCPGATTLTYGPSTYTVTSATTLTITACPGGCHVTKSYPAEAGKTVTAVVPYYTTVCPSPTTIITGNVTVPVPTPGTYTVPCQGGCTITTPVSNVPQGTAPAPYSSPAAPAPASASPYVPAAAPSGNAPAPAAAAPAPGGNAPAPSAAAPSGSPATQQTSSGVKLVAGASSMVALAAAVFFL